APMVFVLSGSRCSEGLAVAQLTALDRGEARRKRAREQGGGEPERELGGGAARFVEIGLGLGQHGGHALVGVSLRQAGVGGDELREIHAVAGRDVAAGAEAVQQQAGDFGALGGRDGGGGCRGRGGSAAGRWRGRGGRIGGRRRTEKLVDIDGGGAAVIIAALGEARS